MSERVCEVFNLGRIDFGEAERLQERLVAVRRAGEAPDRLLICEHDPVITVGSAAEDTATELSPGGPRAIGIPVRRVGRGGRATWHGPGQIVGYPILDLREHRTDLHWYLRSLEAAIIGGLRDLGYRAERVEGLTGVWVDGRKVASIGIAVRGWVTRHGFAMNVRCATAAWRAISPCGLRSEQMASLADLAGPAPAPGRVRDALVEALGRQFGLRMVARSGAELLARTVF